MNQIPAGMRSHSCQVGSKCLMKARCAHKMSSGHQAVWNVRKVKVKEVEKLQHQKKRMKKSYKLKHGIRELFNRIIDIMII